MRAVRQSNTKPELMLRKRLYALGFRYRLHRRDLPGTPDLVLPRHRAVIFVHGCFWHRHPDCSRATTPKSNYDFWMKKFRRNMERDEAVRLELESIGWKVLVVWECQLANAAADATTEKVAELLLS